MNPSPLNFGLIGTGRIGQLHADNLVRHLPEASLVMVTDPNTAAAEACAKRLRVPHFGADYHAILARPEIDAILVCSPTDTHTTIIKEAAAAKKHVFCEKPIDADLRRIDEALAAVRASGILLQVGFNRRFDANFQRIRQAIVRGEIGTTHQVHIISRDPGPPPIDYIRRSGGIFMDMTIHDFDMAQFLVDAPVTEVYATGAVRVDPAIGEAGDLDTVTILLKFANGVTAIIENCRQAVYGYDQRVEVFGTGGAIRVDNNYPNSAILSGKDSIRRDLPLNFFLDRYTQSYIDELRAFVAAVRAGGPSPISGEAGRVPVVIAKAARKSCEENRPVRLSEIG